MSSPDQQVRRATIEDLPKLVPLWQSENFPLPELEKRFKEFQLVEGPSGEVAAAAGLQIAGQEGFVHSEAFAYPSHLDELRKRLWDRILMVTKNHGLARIWIQSASPFWQQQGFKEATGEVSGQRPPVFAGNSMPWLYLQLREPINPAANADKEFALFKEAERESIERLYRQARMMKILAGVVAVGVLILVIIWAFSFFKTQGQLRAR